ncbi:family 16 glycoside hydrolase [Rubellicoccus peritrichatus]|uniref:Family 16 glycoside hydrolase n=1 Tax=Rubellicoccus peritrichatus TaxID=3080537 RepID=A0AAQ3L5G9_9BACT|nr:family 16 glycoside hydrolase [Puniceicoccus sp. CR14]WOO39545.1 family 16 glycoside hydrolase [Puniceicoccus sp. CR14]
MKYITAFVFIILIDPLFADITEPRIGFNPLFDENSSSDSLANFSTLDREYGDIELILDFKSSSGEVSGLYLRGDNEIHTGIETEPNKWNKLKLRHIGNRMWIWLNDDLILDGLETCPFIENQESLPAKGRIRLESADGVMKWANIWVRELVPEEANEYLRVNESGIGFSPVFNGKDLDGWRGDKVGKSVHDEVLKWEGGGHLYTEDQYTDFILRFEFTLSPGANNGLAIRSTGHGNPAYDAMTELQILDNNSQRYEELDSRQYHGSAYGMAAARRGYLRNPGEWNYQEVQVIGSTIRVELNGTVILETDLSEVTDYLQNKEHPGKMLEEGYIGFAGHGNHALQFRNISIKEVD